MISWEDILENLYVGQSIYEEFSTGIIRSFFMSFYFKVCGKGEKVQEKQSLTPSRSHTVK